jgi:AcrR family transcriptional regulator
MASDRYGEIVEAATTLFSKKGYEATSVRDIADAVHLKPGSLYAHIRSKDDLLVVIIERVSDVFRERAAVPLADTESSIPDRVRAFLKGHMQTIAENLPSATVFLHEWERLDPERQKLILKVRTDYEDSLASLIEEGVRRGDFRDVSPRMAAKAFLSLANWAYTWYSPKGRLSVEEIADQFFDMLFTGVGGDGAAPTGRTRRRVAKPVLTVNGDGTRRTRRAGTRS